MSWNLKDQKIETMNSDELYLKWLRNKNVDYVPLSDKPKHLRPKKWFTEKEITVSKNKKRPKGMNKKKWLKQLKNEYKK